MRRPKPFDVLTLGLFEKRIEGDNCLLELARQRFLEAGMGAEMHASTPEQLDWLMHFRPWDDAPVIVHLPRDFNLGEENTRRQILEFARRFAGRISGLVLHDTQTLAAFRDRFVEAAWQLDNQLEKIDRCPLLFVEYAAGLEPGDFAKFFAEIPDLERIGPCIDIGHVGIRAARAAYARNHAGEDICALKSQASRLPHLIDDVQAAVASGAAAVLNLIDEISPVKKPAHFHLHDGHPLSTMSFYGVSDHLSFLTRIPLSFEYRGLRTVAPMFGPAGLSQVVARTLERMGNRDISFTLEIHETAERLPLGDAGPLFEHWTDKTNAEKMNHWLSVLSQNHALLRRAIDEVQPPESSPTLT